jgi:hypothetical protein
MSEEAPQYKSESAGERERKEREVVRLFQKIEDLIEELETTTGHLGSIEDLPIERLEELEKRMRHLLDFRKPMIRADDAVSKETQDLADAFHAGMEVDKPLKDL